MKQWSAVFAALLGVLVFRNRFLFSTPIHEVGDTGANSIIIGQAKQFALLVGNYSRQGFSHPGPAYFYVQGFGESVFHDLLGIVPTPWNGQILALYALHAAFLATVALIVAKWSASWFTATTALLAVVLFISLEPKIVSNAWMPFVYVPSFLLLVVAVVSVAAGHTSHLWAAALAGGFLMHGHAVFLLFVPAVAAIALFLRWRAFSKRDVAIAGAILALFALPIVLHTALHWPGEFGKYIGYGSASHDDGRSILDAVSYVYWYWWPVRQGWLALLGIPVTAAVVWAVARYRHPVVKPALAVSAVVTALLVYYAYSAIDLLDDPYMGFFYWAVPLLLIIVLVMRLGSALRSLAAAKSGPDVRHLAVPLVLAVIVMLVVPGFRTWVGDDQPAVPAVLAAFDVQAQGRPIVLDAGDDIGPEVPALVNWARRQGMQACVQDAKWAFITTSALICSPSELASGVVFQRVRVYADTPSQPGEVARAGSSAFTLAHQPARPLTS